MGKGEIYALLAALTWSFALVFFKRSGEAISPMALNLFKNLIGFALLLVTLLAFGDVLGPFAILSHKELWIFCISGVLGIAVADSLLFASLNRVGVTRFTIVDCAYSPSVIAFSWLMLDERIGWSHAIGGSLIVGGILFSIKREPSQTTTDETDRRQLLTGIGLGILAILAMAYAIVMVKPILEKVDLFWSSAGRLLVGTIGLAIWMVLTDRNGLRQALTPHPTWKFSIPGAILGTYLSVIFWLGGFKYAKASTAGLLNQSTLLFAIPLSYFILKEKITRWKIIALLLAVAGVIFVTLKPL